MRWFVRLFFIFLNNRSSDLLCTLHLAGLLLETGCYVLVIQMRNIVPVAKQDNQRYCGVICVPKGDIEM